ncbi:MAG TPA: heme-binding domain-containing protein [Candidatus Polarisedimenticolia bacterium]|nr:heme-binding domain-containing protein [Candidatus Polarisedimenticolia bacterium]
MRKWLKRGLLAAGGILIAIQAVPVHHDNPPVSAEVEAPEEVRAILRRSCYDCHSHQARRPWYAYVAPSSWLVEHDVNEGRRHLNLSTWDRYDARARAHHIEEIGDEVQMGTMPLWYYLPLHPQARLSAQDKEILMHWTEEAPAAEK